MKTVRRKKEPKPAAMTPAEFREILERRGLTQRAAADLLGYTRVTVNWWATGRHPIVPAAAALIRTVLTPNAR